MNILFKFTKKDIKTTEDDKEDFEKKIIGRLCEKHIESDKVRDHCHLTGKYRDLAHNTCNVNDSNFFPPINHKFRNYDCHIFLKKLFYRKKIKVECKIILKINDKHISVRFVCVRFIHSYRFLSSSSDELVGTLVDKSHKSLKNLKKENDDNDEILNIVKEMGEDERTIEDSKKDYPDKIENLEGAILSYMGENDLKILKTEIPDKWKHLTKKLKYPYENFKSIEDYEKQNDNLKNEGFFKKLKNKCPDDKQIERAKENIKNSISKVEKN